VYWTETHGGQLLSGPKLAKSCSVYQEEENDGRKGRPKHVELLTPNKEHKVASRWHLYDQDRQ